MENQKLNLQTVVAVVFIFIFVAATITTVFGQEKTENKKEHTKIIQLKVVEDENGVVKSIDTTFVMDQDEDFDFGGFYEMKFEEMGDSMKVMIDIDGDNFWHMDMDSLMQEITIELDENGNISKQMMFISGDMDAEIEKLEKEMEEFVFSFDSKVMECDSLTEVIIIKHGDGSDSLIQKHIKHFDVDSKDGNVFIYSDGQEVKIDEDGIVKVIKLGDGNNTFVGDTIIEDGDHKIIIKIVKSGNELEQIIEYISGDESELEKEIEFEEVRIMKVKGGKTLMMTDDSTHKTASYNVRIDDGGESSNEEIRVFVIEDGDVDVDKDIEVRVIKEGKEMKVWVDEKGTVYELDGVKYNVSTPDDDELGELKDSGVKVKSRDLEVENMKFSPNPSNGKFNLSFNLPEKKKVTINIYDIKGNLVYTETLRDFQGEYQKEIDISEHGEGAFFLQIVQGLYDIIKKIIIQ